MALPFGTTGSLCPAFAPDRLVGLTVKHPFAITLYARLPSVLRVPLKASVTLLEATTPVKLPTIHCPRNARVSSQIVKGPYFNSDSKTTGVAHSQSPAYPTHLIPGYNIKL